MNIRNTILAMLPLLFVACQTTETKTAASGESSEYIVNAHNFDDYKKFDHDKSASELKINTKIKGNFLSYEDSIANYLNALRFQFQLREKQIEALSYIYSKYKPMETKLKLKGDTVKLNKILAEKERSIKVVLVEKYNDKMVFDKQYVENLRYPNGILSEAQLDAYLNELAAAITLNDNKKAAFKRLVNSYDKSIAKGKAKAVKVLKSKRNQAIKNLIGDDLYNKKLAFDKNHPKPIN